VGVWFKFRQAAGWADCRRAPVLGVREKSAPKVIVSRGERTKCDDTECELLYPKIETGHAVVNRMKEEAVG
jgi:hypothetical protein